MSRSEDRPQWLCFATRSIVPSHEALLAERRRMETLAAAGDGDYDGWGAAVVR